MMCNIIFAAQSSTLFWKNNDLIALSKLSIKKCWNLCLILHIFKIFDTNTPIEFLFFLLTWTKGSSELFWSNIVHSLSVCPSVNFHNFTFLHNHALGQAALVQNILGERGFNIVLNEGPHHLSRGDNLE